MGTLRTGLHGALLSSRVRFEHLLHPERRHQFLHGREATFCREISEIPPRPPSTASKSIRLMPDCSIRVVAEKSHTMGRCIRSPAILSYEWVCSSKGETKRVFAEKVEEVR